MKYVLVLIAFVPAPAQDPMKVSDIVGWIEKESKRKFVADEGIVTAFYAKRIAVTNGTLDASKAYDVGLALLRTAGVAAIPLEDGTVRLTSSNAAPREQLRVYSNAGDLPKADEFCTLTIALKHLDVREAHAALINLCSPMSIIPAEGARTVIVSDFASNIRKIVDVLKQIDVPKPTSSFRISVAVLEATNGEASVPDAFKGVDLSSVNRNRFAVLGEASARVDIDTARPSGPKSNADVALRLGSLLAEFSTWRRGEQGPILERFTLREDKDATQIGPRLVETRVELPEGSWVVVASVPAPRDGTTLVLLAKAAK